MLLEPLLNLKITLLYQYIPKRLEGKIRPIKSYCNQLPNKSVQEILYLFIKHIIITYILLFLVTSYSPFHIKANIKIPKLLLLTLMLYIFSQVSIRTFLVFVGYIMLFYRLTFIEGVFYFIYIILSDYLYKNSYCSL